MPEPFVITVRRVWTGTVDLEVRRTRCPRCEMEVTLAELQAGITLSRIDGDSANGYEPWHDRCLS